MSKPFAMPPNVDASLVAVMRRALMDTYTDPAFLAEARTMKLDFQPKTAEEIQQVLGEVLATPPAIAAQYRQIIQP
jgi:hypothetical protein